MISPAYCRQMVAYNASQNNGLIAVVDAMDEGDLRADRGAFFGSIWSTMNHLIWGDAFWLSRLHGTEAPSGDIAQSVHTSPDLAAWRSVRKRLEVAFTTWAAQVQDANLEGDMILPTSGFSKPMSRSIIHIFNHQTHHRGQIHAMLTAAGATPQATDLAFMPED